MSKQRRAIVINPKLLILVLGAIIWSGSARSEQTYVYVRGVPSAVVSADFTNMPVEIEAEVVLRGGYRLSGIDISILFDGTMLELIDENTNPSDGINAGIEPGFFDTVFENMGYNAPAPGGDGSMAGFNGVVYLKAFRKLESVAAGSDQRLARLRFKVKAKGKGIITFLKSQKVPGVTIWKEDTSGKDIIEEAETAGAVVNALNSWEEAVNI